MTMARSVSVTVSRRFDSPAERAGTRLHVRHVLTLFEPSAAWMIGANRTGWEDGLDKLEALVVTLKEGRG